MSGAPTPPVLLEPIAADAASDNITNPMPNTPTGTNAASVQLGFPPITMESELSGGEPPLGQDMNGFLYLISSHTMAVQCGQPYLYNASVVSAIGGYLTGTILGMADGTGLWMSTISGNTNNPDTTGVAGGWTPVGAYGVTNVLGLTGGATALTPSQYKYPMIIFAGALTSNQIIQLPNTKQQWLLINQTSGAFALTAQTAASGSTGVAIPQGGRSQPVGVYCLGDGNIYPVVAPLSVAISQAATPLTLAERTNAGYLLATYFNGNTNLENPTVGAVLVQNTAEDGFFRKIPLAAFAQQLVAAIGGASGLCLNFGPYKVQGGLCNPNGGSVAVTFPEPFSSFVFPVAVGLASGAVQTWIQAGSVTVSGMTVANSGGQSYWLALGE